MEKIKPLLAGKSSHGEKNYRAWKLYFPRAFIVLHFLPHPPLPSSKKSVMVAEVQRLQGLEASMEVRMEDISRLSLFTPKRSSQNLESSWDKPSRWPEAWRERTRCTEWMEGRETMRLVVGLHMQQEWEKKTYWELSYQEYDIRQYFCDIYQQERCADRCACPGLFIALGVCVCVSMPTYLMRDCKGSVKPVVLDDSAASLRRADGADVCHAQGVAGVVATEVLDKRNAVSLH